MNIKEIRSTYKNLQNMSKTNQTLKINNVNTIQQYQIQIQNAIKYVQLNNDFDKIQELLFYQQKYEELIKNIKEAKQKLTSPTKYQALIQKILKDDPPIRQQPHQTYQQLKQIHQNSGQIKQQLPQIVSFNPKIKQTINQSKIKQDSKEKNTKTVIQNFFLKKSQLHPNSFKSVIEHDSHSSSSLQKAFRKKGPIDKDAQIKKLMQQNKKIHELLENKAKQQRQINQFQKNLLKQQKDKYAQKIQQLEAQIQHLSKDNYKTKQFQKSSHSPLNHFHQNNHNQNNFHQSDINNSFQERSHTFQILPYNIPMKPNNLQKINQKNNRQVITNQSRKINSRVGEINNNNHNQQTNFNYQNQQTPTYFLQSKHQNRQINQFPSNYNCPFVSNQQPIPAKQNNYFQSPSIQQKQKQLLNLLNSSGISQKRSQFQTFDMAKSYSHSHQQFLNASRQQHQIDSKTSTRNKVAFFKRSLVIVRDNQYEIAFKKSDLDQTLTHVRIIFYILNKTNYKQNVKIDYDYQPTYFNIKFQQKIFEIKPNQQARQSLLISMIHKQNLNSVIDMKIKIGQKRYDLWVPICFIKFTNDPKPPLLNSTQLTVDCDRQFNNYQNMSSIIPIIYDGKDGDAEVGHIYGQSKYFKGGIKLTWYLNQVTIESSQKWVDFIGFILHRYK